MAREVLSANLDALKDSIERADWRPAYAALIETHQLFIAAAYLGDPQVQGKGAAPRARPKRSARTQAKIAELRNGVEARVAELFAATEKACRERDGESASRELSELEDAISMASQVDEALASGAKIEFVQRDAMEA
jgi:hypothetical protein